MAEAESDQKTEEATEGKLQKERRKGNVPSSREVGHAAAYLAVLVLLMLYLPAQGTALVHDLGSFFLMASEVDLGTGNAGLGDIWMLISPAALQIAAIVFGGLGIFMVLAIGAVFLQGPLVLAIDRIMPKPNKFNPLSGIKRIFGRQNLFEFGKNVLKLALLVFICGWVGKSAIDTIAAGQGVLPTDQMGFLLSYMLQLLGWILGMMIPVAALDALWKRFDYAKRMRMTLQEVKDDTKESMGDPVILAARARQRRILSKRRMKQAVAGSTLVLTNPTHFAVALKYERGVDTAPVCVAKGADHVARRIRAIAHENDVPVIENRPLARALYAATEIDDVIPEAHWPVVAELVGFVLDMRRKIRRPPPAGSSLRDD